MNQVILDCVFSVEESDDLKRIALIFNLVFYMKNILTQTNQLKKKQQSSKQTLRMCGLN